MNEIKSVYICEMMGFIKIGISNNPINRMKTISAGTPFESNLLYSIEMPSFQHAFFVEQKSHEILKEKKIKNEWFNCIFEEAKNAIIIAMKECNRSGVKSKKRKFSLLRMEKKVQKELAKRVNHG